MDVVKQHIVKKLSKQLKIFSTMIAGVDRFKIYVSPERDESYYTEDRKIVIGLKSILTYLVSYSRTPKTELVETLAESLVSHEIGHHRFTKFVSVKSPIVHSLLNIAEDQRIEKLMSEEYPKLREYFNKLHQFSYDAYYTTKYSGLVNLIATYNNPINHLILIRWKRWGVKVDYSNYDVSLPEVFENLNLSFEEYLSDWDKLLTEAEQSPDTESVSKLVREYYKKYEKVFKQIPLSPQTDAGLGGDCFLPVDSREVDRIIEEDGLELDSDSDNNFCSPYADEPGVWEGLRGYFLWEWNSELLSQLREIVKRWKTRTVRSSRDYGLSGRRVSARRIAQQKIDILRRDRAETRENTPRLLFVIDGSGSMMGAPFVNASHLARVLAEEFKADVCICNDDLRKPLLVTDWSVPQKYSYSCGEGLEIVKPLLKKNYNYAIFFTDCCIDDESWKTILSSKKFVVVYTSGREDEIDTVNKEIRDKDLKAVVEADVLTTAVKLGRLLQSL